MERSTRVIRPPQVDDVWYVKLHAGACCVDLDTVLITERTAQTVKLVFLEEPAVNGLQRAARYATSDVVWVELVRVMPRVVEKPACLMPRLDPLAPPSEVRPQELPSPDAHMRPRPPTRR